MVSSNKILTVSYGTFSCTLEGFDNSFDTMKAIAEYFRDLAQDDRYFGAEPPTPDAEMLARIAEREIERRVEARFEKGNLVLRPTDEAEAPRGDVASGSSSDAALVNAATGLAATGLVAANTLETDDSNAGLSDDNAVNITDAIAEPADLRAEPDAVATDDDAPDTTLDLDLSDDLDVTDNPDLTEGMPDELRIDAVEPEENASDATSVFAARDEHADDSSIDDLIAAQNAKAPGGDALVPVQDAPVQDAPSAPAASDSVADKLQRIRAVVAAKPQPEPDYIEDEHAMSGPDSDGEDENDAIDVSAEIPGFDIAEDNDSEEIAALPETAVADEDTPVSDLDEPDDNLFTDTIAALVNDQIDAEDDEDDAILPDVPYEDGEQEDVAVDAPDALDEIEALRAKIAQLEAQAAAAKAPVVDFEASDMASLDPTPDSITETDENEDAAETASEPAQPLVARVAKAKRSDVEAALASGVIEEYDDENDDDAPAAIAETPVPGSSDSSLTAEQEAELARELAELQAEIEEDDDWNFDVSDEDTAEHQPSLSAEIEAEEEAEANIRKAVKLTSPARAMLTDTPIEDDTNSVDRLIDQTESEMEEPEGNRRRSAIAHLRAAVAATRADRLLGIGKKKDTQEEPYREDLADAVRPRRPVVTQAHSERPAPVRPAPLKLVAEQRVDSETGDDAATPVRPRRVLRSAETADQADEFSADDGEGFAEFAENQGANTLPELLEAAAAYMSFVEGRDQFSRPQLMTKLHQAEGETSSREERLRSFGQLLREGKIEKKGGGRFTASDNIGFKPKARAAG